MESEKRYVRCVPFTRTKRLPSTIGDVYGYTKWPLPMTTFQFSTFVLVVVGGLLFWHLWAHFGKLDYLIYVGAVLGSKYATRQVRIEGRAPWGAALGLVGSLTSRARVNGLAYNPTTVTRYKAHRMLLIPDEHWRYYILAIEQAKHSRGLRSIHLHRKWWVRRPA